MADNMFAGLDDVAATPLDVAPSTDGYYKVKINLIPENEDKPHLIMLGLTVVEGKEEGTRTLKTLNNPAALREQGKDRGAELSLAEWKGACISTGVPTKAIAKAENVRAAAENFDGKVGYIYFEPHQLVRNSNGYSKVTFVTKEKYESSKDTNGQRMAAFLASGGTVAAGGKAPAKKADLADLD